ncbi:MAG: pyridine nucleotide-disulfide oxidoreductase [Chloroflexi bacterium]|nr:FAD-dependent oxidoreductase [Anaerolineales bacterium]RIK51631.1 MAG: pyridine nucleotide-disulfide oxidoreductase [Chloroflexota bacterium]
MKTYKYLIIGGGMTADAAVRGIREVDAEGSIGMIGMEADMPYGRPPLSKGLWKGRPLEKIWRGTDKFDKVDFHLGRKATELDTAKKQVRDDKGEEYAYEKLLIATGGAPIHLPFGGEHIIYYRTLQDYQRLRELTEKGSRFLVIGAGFIGSEIAAVLNMQGKQVTMVFLENSIGENIYPPELSQFLNDAYRKKGVELVPADGVANIEETGTSLKVQTRSGRVFEVDGIVAGLGVRPNVELAKSANLKVENGIVVDEHLLTSAPDVYAAGDVAMFPHAALGKMFRVEHEDNALMMGKQAGRNMAGANESYTHTPQFYSDLFEFGYEAVGELSSKMEMVTDWQEPFQKGAVYYLDGGRVRGVLLWNLWKKVKDATALIAEAGPFKAEDLIGRIKGE